ncbi:unnamed protein product, partial [Cyprideis torosa]
SDHYNFAKKGIPAIFYFNGVHADYHRTTDTVEKINFEKMEKEVQMFYDRIPKDSLPYLDSEVELGELVIKPVVNEEQKAIAKQKLEGIMEKIVSGEESFEAMALKYSMDPGSGARGGDLGFAKRGSYVPEFEAAVFSLKEGELSEIIETEYGFHIIKQLER